jgi:hypothetical protein
MQADGSGVVLLWSDLGLFFCYMFSLLVACCSFFFYAFGIISSEAEAGSVIPYLKNLF